MSIALAQHFKCDILSCDSRQFFKEMTIGTAVPTQSELGLATHHFVQNKSIFENYTVGDFEKEAIAKLDELYLTNDYVILVGGSGLYVDAILKGFDEFPEIKTSVREEVNYNYEKSGISYLQQQLETLDLDYFKELSVRNPQTLQNPQRMMRFIEVSIGTGQPYYRHPPGPKQFVRDATEGAAPSLIRWLRSPPLISTRTASPKRAAPTCCCMRTIPSTGIRGDRKPWSGPRRRRSRSFCRSGTPVVSGAM